MGDKVKIWVEISDICHLMCIFAISMNKFVAYILAVFAIVLGVHCAYAKDDASAFTVVIDPGHGGRDLGCQGSKTREKDVVLDVAKRLGKLITDEHPDVKVIYTRSDDRFIELNRRAEIANDANADLFISIHVNSLAKRAKGRKTIKGASVYTLGLHRTDDNLAVAMLENSAIELEEDYSETYQGFDPNSSESYIIFELTQNVNQHNSIELADAMQRELVSTAGRADKGVRQSGFLVLRATSMPAVLVELDFMCNPACEKFLASVDGKKKCARALANAFSTYYSKHRSEGVKAAEPTKKVNRPKTTYWVQFFTSPTKLSDSDSRIKIVKGATYYEQDGRYKYICGNYRSLDEAKKRLRIIKKTYPEAFIIKMRDGKRLD